ncbi:MAG: hypothetical protein EAZ89_07570, partial [Bacteroidetes bacterium]
PYSCQSGLCGMCKLKCISGEVHMKSNQALTAQELAAGYVLMCQALPLSENVEVAD